MCCREKVFSFTKIHVRDYKQETVGINGILHTGFVKKMEKV